MPPKNELDLESEREERKSNLRRRVEDDDKIKNVLNLIGDIIMMLTHLMADIAIMLNVQLKAHLLVCL